MTEPPYKLVADPQLEPLTMTYQAFGSGSRERSAIRVNSAGLALGLLIGGLHLGWALLVATGLAQPLLDFVSWLHFVKPAYAIEPFAPFRATSLVLLTGASGYVCGSAFAWLWNHVQRQEL